MDEVIESIEKYQGLVPLVYDIETMVLDEARPQDMPYAVYLKREADKVIAHQKFKRCLAMAEKCDARYDEEDAKVNGHAASWEHISKEMKYWERWRNRWLAIAEKFKPNPTINRKGGTNALQR